MYISHIEIFIDGAYNTKFKIEDAEHLDPKEYIFYLIKNGFKQKEVIFHDEINPENDFVNTDPYLDRLYQKECNNNA